MLISILGFVLSISITGALTHDLEVQTTQRFEWKTCIQIFLRTKRYLKSKSSGSKVHHLVKLWQKQTETE